MWFFLGFFLWANCVKLKCGLHRQQQDAVQGRAKPTSLVCHTHSQTETRMDCMLYELVPFGEENEVIANNNISTHLHVCACEDMHFFVIKLADKFSHIIIKLGLVLFL